jgi:hypothetical protein
LFFRINLLKEIWCVLKKTFLAFEQRIQTKD